MMNPRHYYDYSHHHYNSNETRYDNSHNNAPHSHQTQPQQSPPPMSSHHHQAYYPNYYASWEPNAAAAAPSSTSGMNDFDRREKALLDSVSSSYHRTASTDWGREVACDDERWGKAASDQLPVKTTQQQQVEAPWRGSSGRDDEQQQDEQVQSHVVLRTPSPAPSVASTSSSESSSSSSSKSSGNKKNSHHHVVHGRKGDPRMHAAVSLRLERPTMPLLDALIGGGFNFIGLGQPGASDRTVKDDEGILLYQRKNQLNRRIRLAKSSKNKKEGAGKSNNNKGKKRAAARKSPAGSGRSRGKQTPTAPAGASAVVTPILRSNKQVLRRDEGPIDEHCNDDDFRRPFSQQQRTASAASGAGERRRNSTASLDDFFMALPDDELDRDLLMDGDEEKFFAELTQDSTAPPLSETRHQQQRGPASSTCYQPMPAGEAPRYAEEQRHSTFGWCGSSFQSIPV